MEYESPRTDVATGEAQDTTFRDKVKVQCANTVKIHLSEVGLT